MSKRNVLVSTYTQGIFALVFAVTGLAAASFAQESPTPSPTPTPAATPMVIAKNPDGTPAYTGEQVAESVVIIYGGGAGRALLDQIRKTTLERGKISVTGADGRTDTVTYQRWVKRGENLFKDKIRFEQDFPDARYSMVSSDEKIFGIYNDQSFTPREDAVRSFENQIFRGLDGLLRYKENGSTAALAEKTRQMGVEYYVVDITDTAQRKTRYYVSVKSLRVLMLEYEENGVKYKRRFYDYRPAQGTLVPHRSVLWADDKVIEEVNIGTITFGQRVDDGIFPQA
ncbi:MAG: hypothetical protein QUS14_08030 [Pyrinomonadaceae bacterium]|nr:hypothetical protein [Pyrinomonadaceae bacterium]